MFHTLVLDCIDGVYIANFGHLKLVLTQDQEQARLVGSKYWGRPVDPYWWEEPFAIRDDTKIALCNLVHEIWKALGDGGIGEFIQVTESTVYLKGFCLF